jgi:hypothetical protein
MKIGTTVAGIAIARELMNDAPRVSAVPPEVSASP